MMEPISIWPYIISCAVLCIPGILMIVTGLLETRRLNAQEKRRDALHKRLGCKYRSPS